MALQLGGWDAKKKCGPGSRSSGQGQDGGKVGEEEGWGSAAVPDTGASVSSRAPGGSGSFSWSHRADTQGEVAMSESGV